MGPSRTPGRPASGASRPFYGAPQRLGPHVPHALTAPAPPMAPWVPDPEPGPLMVPTQFHNLKYLDLDVLSAPYPLQIQRRNSLDSGICGPYRLEPACLEAVESFPVLEGGPHLSFMYDTSNIDVAPSVSMSSHSSTVSRRSSARSTLSSIQTDIPQQQQQHQQQQQQQQQQQADFLSGPSSWSRGPSPLRNIFNVPSLPSPTELSEGTVRGEELGQLVHVVGDDSPPQRENPEGPSPQMHQHICHWNDNGPCKSGAFATRDELNWHVKAAHLLVCPVLGCKEGLFANESLVDCHIRWAHKTVRSIKHQGSRQSTNLLGPPEMARTSSAEKSAELRATSTRRGDIEEKRLKMEMSVATSKKRCREQLRNLAERKLKRAAGGTPRSIESPGMMNNRTARLIESIDFPIIWEHGVLPFLVEMMPKWCGPGHAITVLRGRRRDSRRISLMTAKPISKARKLLIASHVRDLLPENYKSNVSFVFSVGNVERLTWARGLTKDSPDEVCDPRNPFCYISPQMGDSIGMMLPGGEDVSATLGPCVKIGDAAFWLANYHPFADADLNAGPITVEHPSPADRDRCLDERHDALEAPGLNFELGELTATSGYDLKTTRITHEPYWEDCAKEPPLVVTDWSLVSAKIHQANLLRKLPTNAAPGRETPITRMSSVMPGVDVCSTGRTSGHQRAQVCEIPAYLDGKRNGTGKATREWFIEEPYPYDNEEGWIRGGMGVPGDSGAAVIECETNALIGQLWGRNKYFGPGPRVTYFSPILDVFDDIQERCGEQSRPQLPQYRDEADRWPVYPICRPCFDLQECMASRRSSHASIMSMIPGAGEKEHDLVSVSELATPKEAGDQSYWIRHAGVEDPSALASSSFSNVVSPAPVMSTFFYHPPAASPRPSILEMRSPYALELSEEDLHDHATDVGFSGLGKRTANTTTLVRSVSQQSGKRRRIM